MKVSLSKVGDWHGLGSSSGGLHVGTRTKIATLCITSAVQESRHNHQKPEAMHAGTCEPDISLTESRHVECPRAHQTCA